MDLKSKTILEKVGIVIVSYNASLALRITLDSICQAKNITPYKVIVVDNASKLHERHNIKKAVNFHRHHHSLNIDFIQLSENLGFSGGNNVGIEKFLEDNSISHICLLNSDVIVTDFWLDRLILEGFDIVSPVTNKSSSDQVVPVDYDFDINMSFSQNNESIFDVVLDRINSFSSRWFAAWEGNYIETSNDVTFFCVLITRECFKSVGLLDTKFFPGGYEDYDYCIRARKNNRRICLKRDVFIHHWGSASFGQLARSYFSENANRNKKYLEDKHQIICKNSPESPFVSYAYDAIYSLKNNKKFELQEKFFLLYHDSLSSLLEHFISEFEALSALLQQSNYEVKETILCNKIDQTFSDQLFEDWKRIFSIVNIKSRVINNRPVNIEKTELEISELCKKVANLANKNIDICKVLYPDIIQIPVPNKKYSMERIVSILKKGLKSLVLLIKMKGIVFVAGYPYLDRQNDGYFQRIMAIDSFFVDQWRIYINTLPLERNNNWYERPDEKSLIFNIFFPGKKRWIARIGAILSILKCRTIYAHSILPLNDIRFLYKIPFVTKIIDIHGVVPEEFSYHGDIQNAQIYSELERYLIKRANYIVVVSNAMKRHFERKYNYSKKVITLPIFQDFPEAPNYSLKESYDKPLIIYAGGLQKWQQVHKMIDTIEKTCHLYKYKLFTPSPEKVMEMLNQKHIDLRNIEIGERTNLELIDEYTKSHFGLILRENVVVNNVACPTKLIEYLGMGVVPIVDSENIGDFADLGMNYIKINDFCNGIIPDEVGLQTIAEKNYQIFRKLKKQYHEGQKNLLQCVNKKIGYSENFNLDPLNQEEILSVKSSCDVLVQVDNFLAGGLENAVLDLCKAFYENDISVTLLILGNTGAATEKAKQVGYNVIVSPFENYSYEKLLRFVKPKLVFSHYSIHGAALCAKLKIPIVQMIHNIYMWFTDEQLHQFRAAEEYTTFYIVTSPYTQEYSIKRLGIPEEKIVLLPYGINSEEISNSINVKQRKKYRKKYNLNDQDFVFLNLAAINHQKNIIGLINSFYIVQKACPKAKLFIVGPKYEQSIMDEMTVLIRKHRLEKQIIYTGPTKNPIPYLAFADAFVSSSFFEGGPLVIQEASVANLPIIATKTGINGLFENKKGFHIVAPPIELFAYNDSILSLSSNSNFEKKFAEAMFQCYQNPEKPNFPFELIKLMDKSCVYPLYVKLINQLINDNAINLSLYSESWMSYFKKE